MKGQIEILSGLSWLFLVAAIAGGIAYFSSGFLRAAILIDSGLALMLAAIGVFASMRALVGLNRRVVALEASLVAAQRKS